MTTETQLYTKVVELTRVHNIWTTFYFSIARFYAILKDTINSIGIYLMTFFEAVLYYIDVLLELSHKVGYYFKLTRAFFRYGMYNKIN